MDKLYDKVIVLFISYKLIDFIIFWVNKINFYEINDSSMLINVKGVLKF